MTLKFNRAKQVSEFFEMKYQETMKELDVSKIQISTNFKQLQQKDEELEHVQRLRSEMTEKMNKKEIDS